MRKLSVGLLVAGVIMGAAFTPQTYAQGIEQLLIRNVPVPTPRPDTVITSSTLKQAQQTRIVTGTVQRPVRAIRGTLAQGFDALADGNVARAQGIRFGMQAGSLDRKLLAWAIAISGKDGVGSGAIAKIASDLRDWPGQKAMARNAERALADETLSSSQVIQAFNGNPPVTAEGAITLANAYRAIGNRKTARNVIAPFWRNETLSKSLETKILASLSDVLTRDDHRYRMHQLFYNDRVRAAQRVAAKAEQFSLAKARAAVVRKSDNAKSAILGVAPSSKADPGYTFARIEYARRIQNFPLAISLLQTAPRDPVKLIDGDEWWVERRIAARIAIEKGDPKTAYRLVSQHSAQSASSIIDAEFHAGWVALRFLNDGSTAQRHFSNILKHATRPISKARGYYWLGRASAGETAKAYFRSAAGFTGTYYGQLAAHALGTRKLFVSNPRPTSKDRATYASRDMVRAIARLEALGKDGWADAFYRHLAKTLTSPGELALLAAAAERKGAYQLSLQIGKIANGRGFDVDTLTWPIGAIPGTQKMTKRDRALAYAISRQESTFNKAAVSKANARGMMQLLPGTAKAVAKRIGYKYSYKRLTTDAAYNAKLGSAYLDEQLQDFGGSYVLTFAAYNAGPRRVSEWIERFGDPRGKSLVDVIDWVEQIPFTETRNYVQRILENYQMYKARIAGSGLQIAQDLTRGRR